MDPKRPQGGQLALYAAALVFAFTNLFVKLAGQGFSGLFVSGSRFAIGVVLASSAVLLRRRPLDRSTLPDLILRGLFGALSMVASYVAITITSPGRAVLLANTYPVFVTIFGALLFGERPTKRVWGSLALCVAGAVLVVRDGSGANPAGDLIAIVSSVFAGIAVNYVRRASTRGVDPFLLYLSPAIFGLPVLFFAPMPTAFPGASPLLFLLGVGVGAFVAQALMARGYRSVSASKGSVTFFLETGLTVLLGALFVGETLSPRFVLGLVFIFAGLWFNRR
ncbi:MAG TPA: DMT family transporter [Rectinemataceae bacterium]|nr:DMT family transporter [Rectinemataceae bacterium]